MEPEELAVALGKTFLERRDVKAVQQASGAYTPVRNRENENLPWMMTDLVSHVEGTKTFGHYLVSPEGNTKLFAFDIDLTKKGYWLGLDEDSDDERHECNPREVWLDRDHPGFRFLKIQLRCVADVLAERIRELDIPALTAYSGGKGVHVYGLCGQQPAAVAMELAHMILQTPERPGGAPSFETVRGKHFWRASGDRFPNIEIESFPKQGNLDGKEFGNLLRLPLGINRKTGQRAFFMDTACGYDTFKPLDPAIALEGVAS